MLEYDFNELDNDFITLWSKFLLTNDKKAIIDGIEALAELGQINAVQSWYLVKQNRENKNIDAILHSYNGSNFNELWAMSNAMDLNEVSKVVEKAYKYAEEFCEKYIANEETVVVEYLEKYCDYYKYMLDAAHMASSMHNLYAHERCAEMLFSIAGMLPISEHNKNKYAKPAIRVAKYVKKNIALNLNKEKNVFEFLTNNPQDAFMVAKNHWFFSTKTKEIQFAEDLLTDLSNRELSLTLRNKIKEIKQRKMSNIANSLMDENAEQEYISLIRRMYKEGKLDKVIEDIKREEDIKDSEVLGNEECPVVVPTDLGL